MKNKLFNILLIFVVSFAFVGEVFAADFVVSASADSTTVAKGSEVSIMVNLKASESISDCKFKFENDSTLEQISMSNVNAWKVEQSGADGVLINSGSLSAAAPVNGENIVQLKYKVNDSGNVTIKTIQCVSTENDNSYNYQDVVVSFVATEPVEDTTLKELVVTNGSMSPSSISGTGVSYIINLTSSTFGLTMTASDPNYQDDIVVKDENGNVIADPSNITFTDSSGQGMMPMTITVNGATTYELVAIYIVQEFDNSLQSITINGQELTLVDGQYDYQFEVGEDVSDVVVAATIKDNDNFQFGSLSNAPASFTITDTVDVIIVVEPKDNSSGARSATYTVEVIKKGTPVEDEPDDKPSSSSKPSGSTGGTTGGNVGSNPSTGGTSMYLMAFILVASLIGSIVLYRKNLEGYK